MLEFRKLADSDIPALREGLKKYHSLSSDCTVGMTYIWRDFFETHIAFCGDEPVLRYNYEGNQTFSFPQSGNYSQVCALISEYCKANGIPVRYLNVIDSDYRKIGEIHGAYETREIEIWADYIYDSASLRDLTGKKYNTQRNHINKFLKLYPDYHTEPINSGNRAECIDLLKNRIRKKDSEYGSTEYENALKILENYEKYGLDGLALFCGDTLAGFTCGEIIGDCIIIQLEKADVAFEGVYPMLANIFLREYLTDEIKYVNREDDAGDEGLRRAKLQLHPAFLLHKSLVTVKE